jgi:hypothetical protein
MRITYIKEGKEQEKKAFLLLPFHLGEQDQSEPERLLGEARILSEGEETQR